MASIETRKYIDKVTGKVVTKYRARVRLTGFAVQDVTFERLTDAKEWGKKKEYELKHQGHFSASMASKNTVNDVIDRYLASLEKINPNRYEDVKPMLDWLCNVEPVATIITDRISHLFRCLGNIPTVFDC